MCGWNDSGEGPSLRAISCKHVDIRTREHDIDLLGLGHVRKVPPLRKVECLTAGDDQMIEGADIYQLQGFTLWIRVRNETHEAPIKFFYRNRMDRASHPCAGDH